jgi:hypothetical protein
MLIAATRTSAKAEALRLLGAAHHYLESNQQVGKIVVTT